MTPTLNDFTRALLTPDLSFATLADARAVTDRQGLPRLRRTTRFAEARIEWRGGSWLLFLPLAPQALLRIERTAARLRRLTSNLLASYRILPGEMQWCDTLGTPRTTDLILQELPAGAEFSTALETEEPATLLAALDTLQEGLRSLGFNHRNLKPGNLRWCAGRFVPLRYHDARFGATGADDEAFEALRQLVMEQGRRHTAADTGQTLHDTAASYTALRRLEGAPLVQQPLRGARLRRGRDGLRLRRRLEPGGHPLALPLGQRLPRGTRRGADGRRDGPHRQAGRLCHPAALRNRGVRPRDEP